MSARLSSWIPLADLDPRVRSVALGLVPPGETLVGVDWRPTAGFVSLLVERWVHDPFMGSVETLPLRLSEDEASPLLAALLAGRSAADGLPFGTGRRECL